MQVFVIGATGLTGQAIVAEALSRRYAVTALVRSQMRATPLLPGARLVEGDARDEAALSQALEGCDAVISGLGTRQISLFKRVTLMSEATSCVVALMKQKRIARFICITGLGAGDSAGHGGIVYDWLIRPTILRNIYNDKNRQEAIVRHSGLDWVLVRPTVLTNKVGTGRVRALTDLDTFNGGSIARTDVASFVVDQLNSDEWLWKSPVITQLIGKKGAKA